MNLWDYSSGQFVTHLWELHQMWSLYLTDRREANKRERDIDRLEERQTCPVYIYEWWQTDRQVIYLSTWLVFQRLQTQNSFIIHQESSHMTVNQSAMSSLLSVRFYSDHQSGQILMRLDLISPLESRSPSTSRTNRENRRTTFLQHKHNLQSENLCALTGPPYRSQIKHLLLQAVWWLACLAWQHTQWGANQCELQCRSIKINSSPVHHALLLLFIYKWPPNCIR